MRAELGRRRFLALGVGGTVALASARWAAAVESDLPFAHGVASGDPLPDRVILWTRVTPSAEASPGSGVGPQVRVDWEVATDPQFTRVVTGGCADTGHEWDHTVKVDVTGLDPATTYWYRFRALGATSPAGRTRTAPPLGSSPASVRFGVVSCNHWEWGRFGGYGVLAEQDVDVVLHLGDYIYEYGAEGATGVDPAPPAGREHQPAHECLTLADYRIRHGQYKLDPSLRAVHAVHPMIVIWDDHEIANDTWREGAENHQPEEGDFAARAVAARQAWREWLPVRQVDPDDPTVIHRRFRYGDLVELWMLDERKYRDQQPESIAFNYGSVDPAVNDPDRTMLGAEQRDWLVGGLTGSDAAWKVVGNQVPFFPLVAGAELPSTVNALIEPVRDQLPLVVPPKLYVDDWNGYRAERRALTETLAQVPDVVLLTGDVHETFAADIPVDVGDYRMDNQSAAVEFIVPAIASAALVRAIDTSTAPLPIGTSIGAAYDANLAVGNPWVRYHEGYANGFGIVQLTADRAQCDFWHLEDVTDPETAGSVAASWQCARGAKNVTPASGPLPPRT